VPPSKDGWKRRHLNADQTWNVFPNQRIRHPRNPDGTWERELGICNRYPSLAFVVKQTHWRHSILQDDYVHGAVTSVCEPYELDTRMSETTALTPTEIEEKLKISESMPSIFMQQCILQTIQTMASSISG
jgi:hypothetical protein